MKYLLICLLIGTSLLNTSCTKEKDPVLEISLKTLPSEKFSASSFSVSAIEFYEVDPVDNAVGVSNLQSWSIVDLDVVLNDAQTFLIANDDHWALDLTGMKIQIGNLFVTDRVTGENQRVDIPYVDFVPLLETVNIGSDKTYTIDIVIDFDDISSTGSSLVYTPQYQILVSEK